MKIIKKLVLSCFFIQAICQAESPMQFGPEKNNSLTAPSKMWVKSPLKEVELVQKYGNDVKGIAKSQIFMRFSQTEIPYLIGTIHFHSFPYSKHPENDSPEAVKTAFMKMHKLKEVWQRKIGDNTWVFQNPPRSGPRLVRLYYTQAEKSYAVSTAVLRNAYIDSTEAESEWLQIKIMERELQKINGKTTRFNFDSFPWSIFPKAHAQGGAPCPPPTSSGGPPIGTCPPASSCTGLFPTAQAACLSNIANCQQTNLGQMFNATNNTLGGFRTDINCESTKWGNKVDDLSKWADGKWGEVQPKVDRLLGTFERATDIVDRLTDPVHMAGVAALGAMASTLATGAISLLVQGIGEGISYLYREISGKNEEEIMRKRAENFEKARKQWDTLNSDLTKVEESIDTSIEIFEVIKASGLSLEDFIKNSQNALKTKNKESSKLKFEIDKMQKLYEDPNRNDTEEIQQCLIEADQTKKEVDAEITRLGLLSEKLEKFKKKNGSYGLACKSLSEEIGKLLAKEAVIEKERTSMSLFFASHLWVEQKDAELMASEKEKLVPMVSYDTEKRAAKMEFYNRLFPPVVDTEKKEKVNCKKVLYKLADTCYDENSKGSSGIPILGILIDPLFSKKNAIKEFSKCAVGNTHAHYLPSTDTAPKSSAAPEEYSFFLGVYAKNLVASGKIYNKVEDAYAAKCVKLAVDSYSAYTDRMQQAQNNYSVDLATWNQRLIGTNTYYKENSAIINQLKIESACSSIADGGCMPGEYDCLKLQKESCTKDIQRTNCAEHIEGGCPKPTPACQNKKDDSNYCKYQFENIERCEKKEEECKTSDYPMGCDKYYDINCVKHCENVLLRCKDYKSLKFTNVEDCQKKLAPQVAKCEQDEKSCFTQKNKCVKSSFSNAKFRFERFKTMRKYLDENLCDFPTKKSKSAPVKK